MIKAINNEKRPTGMIIGAGITGPALAMLLKRAGIEATIYEGWAQPRDEAGSFLGLAPNGRDVLRTLEILEEVEARSIPTPEISFLNHRGKALGHMSQPVVTVNRGLLNQSLRDAAVASGVNVEWGKRLGSVRHTERNTVVASFEDGSEAEADFLVGCDGIHSRTRRSVLPNSPKSEYTGVISSGSYFRLPSAQSTNGTLRMTFGLRSFFAYQVQQSGEAYWFASLFEPEEPDQERLDAVSDDLWRQRLLALHRDDHAPITQIIGSTEDGIVRYPIYEMPVLEAWHQGRVCLAGDAAHAMGPHSGQGASMALEDAVVLARCLRDIDDVDQAFAAYQRIRKERVEFVVRETRRIGNSKKPPGAFGRFTRDLILPIFLKKGVNTFEPIYAHHIDWEEKVA